jgi:hypothetical protein
VKGDLNWDPAPDEKTFYRSASDGQRAYLVKRAGKDMLKLDRPMEEILRPMDGTWVPDTQIHPLTPHAIAAIAFAADRALCKAMGTNLAQKDQEWLSQKEQARIKWMESGPSTGDIRDDLYDAIMGTLKPLTDG